MHVNLEIQENAFGYKKGEIIPALKIEENGRLWYEFVSHKNIATNWIGFDQFSSNKNNLELIKEVDYIKKVQYKSTGEVCCVCFENENRYVAYFENSEPKIKGYYSKRQFEDIPEEETMEESKNTKEINIEKLELNEYITMTDNNDIINKINKIIDYINKDK